MTSIGAEKCIQLMEVYVINSHQLTQEDLSCIKDALSTCSTTLETFCNLFKKPSNGDARRDISIVQYDNIQQVFNFIASIVQKRSFIVVANGFPTQFHSLSFNLYSLVMSSKDRSELADELFQEAKKLALKLDSFLLALNDNLRLREMADRWNQLFIGFDPDEREAVVFELTSPLFRIQRSPNSMSTEAKRRLTILKYLTKKSVTSMLRLECIFETLSDQFTPEVVITRSQFIIASVTAFLEGFTTESEDTRGEFEQKLFWKILMATIFKDGVDKETLSKPLIALMTKICSMFSESMVKSTCEENAHHRVLFPVNQLSF